MTFCCVLINFDCNYFQLWHLPSQLDQQDQAAAQLVALPTSDLSTISTLHPPLVTVATWATVLTRYLVTVLVRWSQRAHPPPLVTLTGATPPRHLWMVAVSWAHVQAVTRTHSVTLARAPPTSHPPCPPPQLARTVSPALGLGHVPTVALVAPEVGHGDLPTLKVSAIILHRD